MQDAREFSKLYASHDNLVGAEAEPMRLFIECGDVENLHTSSEVEMVNGAGWSSRV